MNTPRPPLLIVWHSRTGASQAMAEAAASGAGAGAGVDAGSQVMILPAAQVTPRHFLECGAYLFVCPENLGSMSGLMKEMFDRCYYPLLGQIEGRSYTTLIAAGSDGEGAQRQIERIATGWRLRRVADPLIVNLGAQSVEAILAQKAVAPRELVKCREVGAAFAEGLALGVF